MKFKNTCLAIVLLSIGTSAFADQYVRGYTRSNGTYVQPYYRTSPNNTTLDNYSTRGNINPYTGQPGTVNPSDYIQQSPVQQPVYPTENCYPRCSGYGH